ncbi:TPA: glycosyltransferase family 2 protein [Campylobacter jejuni]|nr:glycosyltransferase family 2 protein [Campylobacter jejuni]
MKTVGVVIPIYNVEKYLRECLDSVVNQTYKNLQVVLVNDGSTDENSLNIAKEYTLKDERFILFNKENGGQSTARNVGIEFFSKEYDFKNITQELKENSLVEFKLDNKDNPYNIYKIYKSSNFFKNKDELLNFKAPDIDYIIFLDSDDYWELNCIEECVPRMDGVEVVWFDWKKRYDGVKENKTDENFTWMILRDKGMIHSLEWFKEMQKLDNKLFAFCIQGMIDFIFLKKIKLKFIDKVVSEDFHFGIMLFFQAQYIYILNQKLYTYRIRANSTCSHEGKVSKESILPFTQNIYKDFQYDGYKTKLYHYIASCIIMIKNIIKHIEFQHDFRKIDILKNLFIAEMLKHASPILEFDIDPWSMKNEYKILKSLYFSDKSNIGALLRIQNQLSYKLGQALILNSKSVFGFLSLPFIILSIVISHKQEQKAYKFKVKKNPNLALPPLSSYDDYNEALKEKECFTYKLGEEFIKASKNWYGGGLFLLPYRVFKLYKKFRKKQ